MSKSIGREEYDTAGISNFFKKLRFAIKEDEETVVGGELEIWEEFSKFVY